MNNSKKLRNCKQTKCGYYKLGIGCRPCAECKAEPYLINEDTCQRCWNCENDAGVVRWDDDVTDDSTKEVVVVRCGS